MLGRFMDWIDELTGYDRSTVRAVFVIVAINLVFAALIFQPWDAVLGPDCDSACEAQVQQSLDDMPSPEPFDPEKNADEVLDEVTR